MTSPSQAPFPLFGASYYPQHVPAREWESDLDIMAAAHVNALRVGDFAWKRFEPQEDQYDFEWLDRFFDLAQARGIGVLLIPPMRCAPAWLMEQDPTIGLVNESGVRLEFGSRYTFCINHPRLREKGLALACKMAARYANHPALLGWHLDNEYGDEPDCHCDICKNKWHDWLRERYGSIEDLNRAWGTVFWGLEFDHFGQIPTPRLSKTYLNTGLFQAWRHFRSDCTVEIVAAHVGAVRDGGGQGLFTTNLQSGWNPRTDYFDLHGILDIAGVNYYPPYGEHYRDNALGLAVVRGVLGRNFQLHELRNGPHAVPGRADNAPRPGEIERLTLHCLAHGADAIFYFQWRAVPFGPEQTHGTPTGYDGQLNQTYPEIARIGERLKRLGPVLQNTRVESEIAVLYDFPTRWSLQGGVEWCGPPSLYVDHAKRVYNAIRGLGISCDAIGRNGNFGAYKVLVAPILDCVDEALAERLAAFVEAGGTLVWHPLSGLRNSDTEIYPRRLHPLLETVFGLGVRDFFTAGPDEKIPFVWHDQEYAGRLFCDLPLVQSATAQATFSTEPLKNAVAVAQNIFGQGRGIYLATFADAPFYRDFLEHLCRETGVSLILGAPAPLGIEACERRGSTGERLVFLLNGEGKSQSVSLSQPFSDLETGETVVEELALKPFEVRVLKPLELS